ncbi:ATP-binding protein [Falsibacillus albus]|uniref:histidine kinase n=1 Tax=Falsibacillus albus TaxID=2478915 RepID=A0A3L7JKF3_9BACI|nr:ATP-binding protein [Falsibacillus albus]RLQ90619.1 PAS domain S-box protein [Falsibacillus albus]
MNQSKKTALKIAIVYIVIGVIWIVLSDDFSIILAQNKLQLYIFFQRYKGWLFILVTGVIIYILVYRRTESILSSEKQLLLKEHKLEEKNQRYQSLYHYNPDGVFEMTQAGKLAAVNPEGQAIIGYGEEELKGMNMAELIVDHDKQKAVDTFNAALAGEAQKFEMTLLNADGQERLTRCSLIPIVINMEVTGVFGILRDITESRKSEELMITSEKMSVIGQLAAAVAHEIRNPLTSLKGFVQLLSQKKTSDYQYLDIMMSEIERINLISSEMLILGKNQEVKFTKTDPMEVLNQVMVLMEAEANMQGVELVLNNHLEEVVFIMADQNQLKQVFINIIKNSLEAVKIEGEVEINVERNSAEVTISIVDNGIGIEKARMSTLGEPFYSTKEKGTGLGLAVCFKIIERHQGNIHIESEKGAGTKVTVVLPIMQE